MMRIRLQSSSLVAALVLAIACASMARAAQPVSRPATAPSPRDRVDQPTRDLIGEIDSTDAPATAPPLNDSAGGSRSSSPLAARTRLAYWWRLVELFRYPLMTAAAVGIAGGVVGTFVLLRREALLALAMPEVVAVGGALGMRMGWPTLPPAVATAAAALVFLVLSRRWGAGNWVLPSFYVAGLSISFLLIAHHGQDVAELQKLFTGIDVAVTAAEAAVAAPVLLGAAVLCAALWRRWLLLAQAPAAAELAGLRPARWDAGFLSLLTLVVLLGTDALGTVMVLSMLFLPVATVLPWARRIPAALVAAAAVSVLYLGAAFYLANTMDWPLSQSVGGVGFGVLVLSHLAARVRR